MPNSPLTKPAPFDGTYVSGGVGVVARRQQDPMLSGLCDAAARLGLGLWGQNTTPDNAGAAWANSPFFLLSYMAATTPLRLLRLMLAQDGTAQMAQGIESALAFGAGKARFVAVKDWRTGRGTIDDDATAELERVLRLYQSQSADSRLAAEGMLVPGTIPSGLPLLLHAADRINDTGQACFEAIGDVGVGLTEIRDFDPLSCRYRDSEVTIQGGGKRTVRFFEQQQPDARRNERRGFVDGWQALLGPGICTVAWKAGTDNPYGVPRSGAALSYLLRKAARRRDLGDWLHNVAWPKVIVEQMVSALFNLVAANPELLQGSGEEGDDLSASEWVGQQVSMMQDKLLGMRADDIWTIGEGKAYSINPSGIQGLTDVLQMERLEEIQSLNVLPALVGVTDGGTQAYAEVQWLAQTESLSLLAAYAAAGPVAIGNYHFRLLGEDIVVRAEFDRLPPIDPQKAAEARQTITDIEEKLAIIGVNAEDDFALRVSESGAADPARLAGYLAARLAQLSAATAPPTGV